MMAVRGVALSVVLLLAGCSPPPGVGAGPPGGWCGGGEGEGPATVRVRLAPDGDRLGIAVDPESCRIRPGTELRFVATGQHGGLFERISFKAASPAEDDAPELPARAQGRDRVATMVAREVGQETRYAYNVHAGGQVLDPEVIIDPARYGK